MIIFDGITKKYGSHKVLDNLHLEISAADFICLQGPSGAGKTTLINLLIGFEKATDGAINIDNYKINNLRNSALQLFRRRIGLVFQDYKLLPQKTVFENVAFALEVCGYDDKFITKRVNKVLKMVGIYAKKKHFPRQLSGGEKQRTAIARALVHDPLLIIADEPTGNLDQQNALEIINILTEINQQGKTILLTTHNNELVNSIPRCRIINLDNGRITRDQIKPHAKSAPSTQNLNQ